MQNHCAKGAFLGAILSPYHYFRLNVLKQIFLSKLLTSNFYSHRCKANIWFETFHFSIDGLFLFADANFYWYCKQPETTRGVIAADNISTNTPVKNAKCSVYFASSMSFSQFDKLSNVLICIVWDEWQSHSLSRTLPKMLRMFPLVAMLELIRWRSRTPTSWMIIWL